MKFPQNSLKFLRKWKNRQMCGKNPTSHISVSFQFPGVACGLRLIKAKKKLCCFRDTRMSHNTKGRILNLLVWFPKICQKKIFGNEKPWSKYILLKFSIRCRLWSELRYCSLPVPLYPPNHTTLLFPHLLGKKAKNMNNGYFTVSYRIQITG